MRDNIDKDEIPVTLVMSVFLEKAEEKEEKTDNTNTCRWEEGNNR